MACDGRGDATGSHCCWLAGVECPFLERNVGGRRYSCSLRRTLGSWDRVHADPRYLAVVRPVLDAAVGPEYPDCGDFGPATEQCCYAPPGGVTPYRQGGPILAAGA